MEKRSIELQEFIGYHFHDQHILWKALTHTSYANEHNLEKNESNERLEFLGDAVLELTGSEYLFCIYPQKLEGELSKIRAALVCETSLAEAARGIALGSYILLGKGEERTGGRDRDSILSDAFEALIGAIYLDGGFTNAKEFVHRFLLKKENSMKLFFDSKTILQEVLQKTEDELSYRLLGEEGPDHKKVFIAAVFINGEEFSRAKGRGKKQAEQEAAYLALKKMGKV